MATEVMTTPTETPTTTDVEIVVDPMVKQLQTITELINTLAQTSKVLTTEMKNLTKDVNKLRTAKVPKRAKKPVDPDVPRKLGALEKPVDISEELATFLNLTVGEQYSRQKITQAINAYVKDKNLQNPENRRFILLESEDGLKLKKLLRDPDQPLTFFNIQRYLKPHYPKSEDSSTKKVVDITDKATIDNSKKVVEDAEKVDETETAEQPKKKVVRKVIKKATPGITA
jgi:chromatin remodeling complex protein RSC6